MDIQTLTLHILSDIFIGGAYVILSCTPCIWPTKSLMSLIVRAFILGCGLIFLLDAWNFWHHQYLLAGIVKGITAVFSMLAVHVMFRKKGAEIHVVEQGVPHNGR